MTTACLIIIGNEILSGRTQDKNLAWIAKALNEEGIALKEVRVVADDEAAIVEAVNACRNKYAYVFTTGGIGPTHDDITAASVSAAFGVPCERHPEAERALRAHYGDQINDARLKMAETPRGAALIPNDKTIAPGFRMENVYVMAGIPSIMQTMFEAIRPSLEGGEKTLSKALTARTKEGDIAAGLTEIQRRFPQVSIGSYPFSEDGIFKVTLIARAKDPVRLDAAFAEIHALLAHVGAQEIEEADRASQSADDSWAKAIAEQAETTERSKHS